MAIAARVDSRQYRFAFNIASAEDWPADFGSPEQREGFRTALFLPRDDGGWFGRSMYPPRIVTLYADAIDVRAHPTSKEPSVRIPLSELQFVEDGHILLRGWLRLVGARCDVTLAYNTRSRLALDRFCCELRDAFAPPAAIQTAGGLVCFGEPLDIKFGRARRWHVAPDENVRVQFFHPARRTLRRVGAFRRESWTPGNLLLATDRRLIWITDRNRGRREPYGAITSYTLMRLFQSSSCKPTAQSIELTLQFLNGGAWRILLPPEIEREVSGFMEALRVEASGGL